MQEKEYILEWSSYKDTAGLGKGISCLAKDWILLQFAREKGKAETGYRQFVREGIKEESPWRELKGQLYLGDENFIDKIKKMIRGKETLKEIPRPQRYITKPSLKDILKHKDKKLRDTEVYKAHIRYGYTLKDIADYLGVHYATISRAVRKVEKRR